MNSTRGIASRKAGDSGLAYAWELQGMGVPIVCGRIDEDGEPDTTDRRWRSWEQAKPGEASARRLRRYQPGDAVVAIGGVVLDWLDYDPRNDTAGKEGRTWLREAANGIEPVTRASTPSGGWHMGIPCLDLPKGPVAPGVDYQGGLREPDADGRTHRGFVFIPPTRRPSKAEEDHGEVKPYKAEVTGELTDASGYAGLREAIEAKRAAGLDRPGSGNSKGRQEPDKLKAAVLSAGSGLQRGALLRLIEEYEKRGYPRAAIADILREFLPRVPCLNDTKGPWYPARKHNEDFWVNNLLKRKGAPPIPDGTEEELDGIGDLVPKTITDEAEEEFWRSRLVLTHIRDSAIAGRANPWAVLCNVAAEALCHIPSWVHLPDDGTLNMLFAMSGDTGTGKRRAYIAAKNAFTWRGFRGVPDDILRVPVGSGEGLVKTYGYNRKNEETGEYETVRTADAAIIVIQEIDTLKALQDRGGATISPEIRKFASGEDLGFGWSDPSKRVVIPDLEYRGCITSGVQPSHAWIILNDVDSGFAGRWIWAPVANPEAPDERPPRPAPRKWEAPADIRFMARDRFPEDEPYVIKVCARALAEIDKANLAHHRGQKVSEIDAHASYIREKAAAALMVLDSRAEVTEEDWDLAGIWMGVSNRERSRAAATLRENKARTDAIEASRAGIRDDIREEAKNKRAIGRVMGNVMKHIPPRGQRIADSTLQRRIAKRDRDSGLYAEALSALSNSGKIEAEDDIYKGRDAVFWRRCK